MVINCIQDFINSPNGTQYTVKLKAGKMLVITTLIKKDDDIWFQFGFNKKLAAEIKECFEGRKWHGFDKPKPIKMWSAPITNRNIFQLRRMAKENPFERYDAEIQTVEPKRELYEHQGDLLNFSLTRRYCLIAAEMGAGKSLVAIEAAEHENMKPGECWYVGPVAGVRAFNRECRKWKTQIVFQTFTYEKMTKIIENWEPGKPAPRGVIFDECSKVKTPTAKRTQMAQHLADAVRAEHGENGFVIMLSGTPAPKTPVDWYAQCITGDSWINTSEGLRRVRELVDTPFIARFNGNSIPSKGFWSNGVKDIVTVQTKQGFALKCTPDHKILCDFDGIQFWCEAGSLKKGMNICLEDSYKQISKSENYHNGYLLGLIYGDGIIQERDGMMYGVVSVYKGEEDFAAALERVFGMLFSVPSGESERRDCYMQKCHDLVRKYGCGGDKIITNEMMRAGPEFAAGFVAGLIDTDGCIAVGRLRIQLGQIKKENHLKLQLMLNQLGIRTSIFDSKKEGKYTFQGRKINCQAMFVTTITKISARRFASMCSLLNRPKHNRLQEALETEARSECFTAQVTDVVKSGKDEVFDCEVPKHHRFAANGMIVHNSEIACPGFLREGNIHIFKQSLCKVEQVENMMGQTFPKVVGWWDDERKCEICMEGPDHPNHVPGTMLFKHAFKRSVNQVQRLAKRLDGLVYVLFKKDCLDLPEKQYLEVKVKPSVEVLRAAGLIKKRSSRAVTALTLLRELSDGFQYSEVQDGDEVVTCEYCAGTCEVREPIDDGTMHESLEINQPVEVEYKSEPCPVCKGKGVVPKMIRVVDGAKSGKDTVFKEYLDEYSEIGRFVVWGGFTGTLDRLVDMAHQEGWSTLRVDGKGYKALSCKNEVLDADELLDAMDYSHPDRDKLREKHPRVCFVGHPKAGGMALTLTGSPISLYYSNPFDGEARMQSEDRIHRAGMDTNRGALIVDLIYLPSDKIVLDNLKQKKRLQNMSMGQLDAAWGSFEGDRDE